MAFNSKLEVNDDPKRLCDVCLLATKDELTLGQFYTKKSQKTNISSHYFCLLTATGLLQQGRDESGILGFQLNDIKRYCYKIRPFRCVYCKKNSAAIMCSHNECSVRFHFACGVKNNCVSELVDEFNSYCHKHHRLPISTNPHTPEQACGICLDDMGVYNQVTSHRPSCCMKMWFHKSCLTRATAEAGYYTNCPFCADKEVYIPEIQKFGIFVPNRDATWELEREAYSDLVKRTCKYEGCPNPRSDPYSIRTCSVCGCFPAHLKCLRIKDYSDYICKECFNKTFLGVLK